MIWEKDADFVDGVGLELVLFLEGLEEGFRDGETREKVFGGKGGNGGVEKADFGVEVGLFFGVGEGVPVL